MQTYRTLRKNGISVQLNIPIEFARAFDLNPGDPVLMTAEGDVVTLKFFKKTKVLIPAQKAQEQVVEAP